MSQRDSGYGQYGRDLPDRPKHGRSQGSGGRELTTATPSTPRRPRDGDSEKERGQLQREPKGIQSSETIERGKYRAGSDEFASDDGRGFPTARSRSSKAFSGTSAQRDHSPARAAFCLEDALYQHIRNVVRNDTYGILVVAERPDLFGVDDYLFLLEAIQCDIPAEARFRQACIRLYLLVRKYNSLSEQDCQRFNPELEDRRNHTEGTVQAVEALVQQMSRARGVRMPGGDSLSVSRLSATTPAPVRPHGRRRSAGAPSQRSEDTRQSSLDVDFILKPSGWFTIGRVFIVLWHENDTSKNTTLTTAQGGVSSQGLYGENILTGSFQSTRIMGKVSLDEGSTNKTGEHAIIHMDGTPPQSLRGEPPMSKRPITVVPASEDKKLHEASRIRFDKVFSIEHNVRVKEVGKISPDSMAWFCQYWRNEAIAAANAVAPRSGGHV